MLYNFRSFTTLNYNHRASIWLATLRHRLRSYLLPRCVLIATYLVIDEVREANCAETLNSSNVFNMGQSRPLSRLFSSFSHSNINSNFNNKNWMVCLGFQPRPLDVERRRNHGAMAATPPYKVQLKWLVTHWRVQSSTKLLPNLCPLLFKRFTIP